MFYYKLNRSKSPFQQTHKKLGFTENVQNKRNEKDRLHQVRWI